MMMGYGFGMGWIGWMIHLLVIIAIIYLVSKVVVQQGTGLRKRDMPAWHIAAERYARGEITEEEFKRMKDVLQQ